MLMHIKVVVPHIQSKKQYISIFRIRHTSKKKGKFLGPILGTADVKFFKLAILRLQINQTHDSKIEKHTYFLYI